MPKGSRLHKKGYIVGGFCLCGASTLTAVEKRSPVHRVYAILMHGWFTRNVLQVRLLSNRLAKQAHTRIRKPDCRKISNRDMDTIVRETLAMWDRKQLEQLGGIQADATCVDPHSIQLLEFEADIFRYKTTSFKYVGGKCIVSLRPTESLEISSTKLLPPFFSSVANIFTLSHHLGVTCAIG
jgi:hypothetical protein